MPDLFNSESEFERAVHKVVSKDLHDHIAMARASMEKEWLKHIQRETDATGSGVLTIGDKTEFEAGLRALKVDVKSDQAKVKMLESRLAALITQFEALKKDSASTVDLVPLKTRLDKLEKWQKTQQ